MPSRAYNTSMKSIKLTGVYGNNKKTLVDDDIYLRVKNFKWFLSSPKNHHSQYVRTRIGKNSDIRLHRLIMDFPKGLQVDHINGNILDNRRENLRSCDNKTNQMNSKTHSDKKRTNGILPPKGVYYDKTRPGKPWVARIMHKGKRIVSLGYSDVNEAHEEYRRLATEYFGEFARFS